MSFSYHCCTLCPRLCRADRTKAAGFCGASSDVRIARAALHFWEEPCISGTRGSGTVFFSYCTLQCVFCQNYPLSHEGFGKEISTGRLAEIFLELQEQGAHNLNLVTATQYLPSVIEALDMVRPMLHIPVVYNCGGYERVETIRALRDYVDIYLPDLKYFDDSLAMRYSGAPHYFDTALAAIREMIAQTGTPSWNPDEPEILAKGVILRHMVLPGAREDSIRLLMRIAKELPSDSFLISLLSQYTPFYRSAEYPEINRRLTSYEYQKVVDAALALGLHTGYMQEKSSAKEEYTPPFDLSGV